MKVIRKATGMEKEGWHTSVGRVRRGLLPFRLRKKHHRCAQVGGSVLKMEMTAEAREFTSFKIEACGLTQVAYLHM